MEIKLMGSQQDEENEFGDYSEYEVKEAVSTLIKAEEIKQDSDLMSYVKPLLEQRFKGAESAIKSIADIKTARQNLEGEDAESEESDAE